ncbi:MAG: hypothetical protein M0Q95_16825 [Porticoccaceae bacterium]|nr:hypothetical protein [Porticoccaceae bacterium]
MIQTFDTQLEVSLRALQDVVAPALSGAENHVLEQFNLALATLSFLRQRLPYARGYHRLELQHFMDCSAAVRNLIAADQPELATQMKTTESLGSQELVRPEAEIEDYLLVARKLRELINDSVKMANGKPYEAELDAFVCRQQQAFLPAQRAWCAPLGLDTEADKLPSIDDVLSRSGN